MRQRAVVLEFTVLGWSSLAIGAGGIAILAAASDDFEADLAAAAVAGVLFAFLMWLFTGRAFARRLASPPDPPPAETAPGRSVARMLVGQAPFAVLVLGSAFFGAPVIGVALGGGVWQLTIAAAARRWERAHGQRLVARHDWMTSISRAELFAITV